MRLLGKLLIVAGLSCAAWPVWASCRVHNDTNYSFTVESGNVSNQRVGGHTTTSIAAGKIIAKADSGQSAGGFCADGSSIEIREEKGVVLIVPK